ncbi:MAG: hypothetical protein LAO09_06350 [Acidobacteriia bacterium]|nr:hypothetical protein [Terriglobia bacterium]
MKKSICLVAVLLCAWVSSFGQSNGLPQWKVVKEFHLTNQTNAIPTTVLFTPTKASIYRLSMYLSASANEAQNGQFYITVDWTDQTGLPGTNGGATDLSHGSETLSWIAPETFSPKIGTPVTFTVVLSDNPPPQDASYSVAVIIEKLTH